MWAAVDLQKQLVHHETVTPEHPQPWAVLHVPIPLNACVEGLGHDPAVGTGSALDSLLKGDELLTRAGPRGGGLFLASFFRNTSGAAGIWVA